MPDTTKRGLFVVFEGVEKCGKKTQSELLQEALTQITGKQALLIHFPDKSTPIGKLLAEYSDEKLQLEPHAAHLLYIANRWERQDEISNALKAGISVVVDRYSYSGIANTAAKFHPLSEFDWKWCRSMEYGLLQPDFIFCLAPENFAEISVRDAFSDKKFETMDFQKRILIYYGRLSREMESELTENDDTNEREPRLWHWIPATGQTVDETHSCIMSIIDSKL
ncbi:unnamed protein product [Schistosoma margrebowiei]|uniref:dTMP kinase n=2 Tax=Schistosoma TaxID=6181 RepID=A0A183MEP7_9TREM|nr:unnamed protein product [Schistosoma margrebowiei]VDP16025.1 unnamed protein product [Schistosoma margrebowiei]